LKTLMVVSGGDAPGTNAALAHYTALATALGDAVCGALGGFAGLLAGQIIPLANGIIAPWASQPGSYLPSSREPVLKNPTAPEQAARILQQHGIDNLIMFGGDGTLRHIPPLLHAWGIACVGIPATIDNDVPGTEQTIGFDSACNFAYQAVDGALATGRALAGRIFMVETLGGTTGLLALDIAYGVGAHAVLVPEYAYEDDWLAGRLLDAVRRDGCALLVLSEGVAAARTLAEEITQWTGIRVRDTRLGHGQRGARPTHRDRVLAAHMTHRAYRALRGGATMATVVVRGGQITLHEGALDGFPPRLPDRPLYDLVNGLD
jgi:6-phosphofructokinase 1